MIKVLSWKETTSGGCRSWYSTTVDKSYILKILKLWEGYFFWSFESVLGIQTGYAKSLSDAKRRIRFYIEDQRTYAETGFRLWETSCNPPTGLVCAMNTNHGYMLGVWDRGSWWIGRWWKTKFEFEVRGWYLLPTREAMF
jgi:hypothetical protein